MGPRSALAGLALAALALGLGCATAAKPDGMVATRAVPAQGSAETVSIRVCGGRATFPLGRSQISNDGLYQAVSRSLWESGLLRPVYDAVGDYHLDVCIASVDQPHWAFPMTVELVTDWSLTPRNRSSPLWQETLSVRHTEPFEREFFGIKRLRLATEGAARETIAAALEQIGRHLDER